MPLAQHSIHHSSICFLVVGYLIIMELDTRSRFWTVTIPWVSDTVPTAQTTPLFNASLIHGKYSRANESYSIWYTFINPQKASRLAKEFNDPTVVMKKTTRANYETFQDIPFDTEVIQEKTDTTIDVSIADGIQESQCNDKYLSRLEYEHPSSDTEGHTSYSTINMDIVSDINEFYRLKRDIERLDSQLGRVAKRLKPYGKQLMKVGEDCIDM